MNRCLYVKGMSWPYQKTAIVSYYTVHRERNWAQFCEGVASRSQNKFFYPGPSLTKEEVVQKLNPQLVILTGRIKSDYGRIFSVRQDELQLENQIRQALAEVKNGEINYARQKPGTEVLVGGLKWLIRDDAKMVLAVNLVESSNQDKNAS